MVTLGRSGNFIIKRYGDGRQTWLRITTADGGWRMDFRDDTLKYAWILMCMASENPGVQKALESWITITYHTANAIPDPEYLDRAIDNLYELNERAIALNEKQGAGREEAPDDSGKQVQTPE